ncbi:carboxymuconolactone decarboxylase family protein [Roseivivax sp. CAU 1761]
MSYLATARGPAAEAFLQQAAERHGSLLNLHVVLSHLPEMAQHFEAMTADLKARMGLRRYELVTLAAALELKSSYCALAHGAILLRDGMAASDLAAIARDGSAPGLDAAERALMAYARAIVRDAAAIPEARIAELRAAGLDDGAIAEAAAAAALRCFFSKLLDGLGAAPDAALAHLPPPLPALLACGRAIAAPERGGASVGRE